MLKDKEFNYNFDNIFGYREILTKYLCDCELSKEYAFGISERVRNGHFYNKKYKYSQIPKAITDWFASVKYLPSVRRLLDDEHE